MNHAIKVACVQAAPSFLDLDAGIEKTIKLIGEAAEQGAALIAFPETWLPGYPWFLWLGSPAWSMQYIQRYYENSLVLGSPAANRISEAARHHDIHVVLGYSERSNSSLYIGQWIIDNHGKTVGTRRKLKPTHVERTLFGESDGSSLQTYSTSLGMVGALCCWEHLQPLSKYAMYSQHEEIHIGAWPSFSVYEGATAALGPDVNTAASRTYAAEGQCFVLAPCATVSDEMIGLLCGDDATRHGLLSAGGGHARIYGPDGADLAPPLAPDEEGLLYATLDPTAILYAKTAADPCGHYSRPDVLRLMFNRSSNPCIVDFSPTHPCVSLPEEDTQDLPQATENISMEKADTHAKS